MRGMVEHDRKQIAKVREAADRTADCLLHATLARYASVEPRAGLEARILANLRAAQTRIPKRAWWRLSLAATATAVLVVAVFLPWRSGRPAHPVDATVKPAPQSRETQLVLNSGSLARGDTIAPQQPPPQRAAVHRSRHDDVAVAVPKLDQFPSPRPLSQQEKMLRSYVAEDPVQAVLIARARSEALREDELEEIKASLVDHDGIQSTGKMIRPKDRPKENDMRKTLVVWTIVILGFMIFCQSAGCAQDVAQTKSGHEEKASEVPEKAVHAYRLDFSVNELEDGKKINSRQYSLNLNADDSNELKIGTRIPVEVKQGEFQYLDVGTNIWCRIGERPDGVPLSVRAEISNFAMPEQESGHNSRPALRQLQIRASTLAQLGNPMIVGSVDDPNSKRQFQLEVTVARLK